MHKRHVALFPLPSSAHIYPFLGLCPELVRRGYRVTLATDELHAKLVSHSGAEPVIFKPLRHEYPYLMVKEWPAQDPRWWAYFGSFLFPSFLNAAAVVVSQLDAFYKENRPDLIIYDFAAYAGRILGKRLRTPVIQYYHDFIYQSGFYCWEGGVGYNPEPMLQFSKLLDSILHVYGFEEADNFWHSEDLNMCPFPKVFQFNSDSLNDDRFCFAGPFLDRPFRHVWKNRSNGKRIILVSDMTGSADANYFNSIADSLSASDYHVILSVGEGFPISELRTLPRNAEINQHASHLEILPHADLHLYSGGISGTLEGFHFGVPLIALSSFIHNHRIASRVSELGFALNLPRHTVTKEMIRDSVERVFQDDALLSRVKEMQCVIRNAGRSEIAVDRIERFLSGRT